MGSQLDNQPDSLNTPVPAAAADWYPDPTARHEFRYFDGEAWTQNVSDAGSASVDQGPVTAAPAAAPDQGVLIVDASAPETVLVRMPQISMTDHRTRDLFFTNRRLVAVPPHYNNVPADMGADPTHALRWLTEHITAPPATPAQRHAQAVNTVDVARLDELLLTSPKKTWAVSYADIDTLTLKRKFMLGFSDARLASPSRNIAFSFKRDLFEELVAILTAAIPEKVIVK